ncbi:MAG: flavodoxin family protein [Schwartzia sp. (in: firmicutes)]
MKKILIVYSSKTGNTEKVARALFEAGGEDCDLLPVEKAEDTAGYQVVFAGYWVDRGEPDKKMQRFLAERKGEKIVLFQTLGAEPDSEHAMTSFANAGKYLSPDNKILGIFSVRGAIDPKLIEWMRSLPKDNPHGANPASEKRWADAATHPDAADLEATKKYMDKFNTFWARWGKMM